MKFKSQIPDDIFINPFAEKFVTVMDEADTFKQAAIHKAHRFYRSPTNTNLPFLIKRVEDAGFPSIPSDFPKDVLDALLLNANDINALRGSKIGLRLWLWCLTFGVISVDDSAFYPIDEFIQPEEIATNGYIDEFIPNILAGGLELFLFDDLTQFGVSTLIVNIDTKYWNHVNIVAYINENIKKYLTFTTGISSITINFSVGVYTPHSHPYQYFVNP